MRPSCPLGHVRRTPKRHGVHLCRFMFGGATHTMYVRCRPFLNNFLSALRQVHPSRLSWPWATIFCRSSCLACPAQGPWEVIIFTASVRAYADRLLDTLDPQGTLLNIRMYREHCTPLDGCYTKDLRLLGRQLSRTVIVENTPLSFCFQVQRNRWLESIVLVPLAHVLPNPD